MRHEDKLATAQWADPDYVEEKYAYEDGDFWLGRTPSPHEPAIGYNDDRHICLVSGNRGGKGTTSIVNNLLLWKGSCVVIDPKGENALITAFRRGKGSEYAQGMGQDVHILAPMSKEGEIPEDYRSCFNPLDSFDPEDDETIDEAGLLADAIIVPSNSNDPFWEESARGLIKGLILYVLTSDVFIPEERNLLTVRRLITHGDFKEVEYLGKKYDGTNPHKILFANMRENKSFDHTVSGVGESFLHMADKTLSSVLQTANTNTEFLDSAGMKKCLAKSDFKLSELKTSDKGMSLYLTLPQRYMNTHFRWLRMITTLTITEMEKTKGKPKSGHRVLMILDEFAGLKRMKIIEDAIAQMAGHGLKMMYILQSLKQLEALYKDNWETFLGNAGLKMFFAIEDQFTRKWVSDYIGETEVSRYTETESTQEGTNNSTSTGSQEGWNNSRGTSESRGKNKGASYTPDLLLAMRTGKNRGKNTSYSSNENSGASGGTSQSETEGRSYSSSSGRNEGLHKRPLITPDEIGMAFARIDDKGDENYPGLGLALISGQDPIAYRKCPYFEDSVFENKFDPHPDHEFMHYKDMPHVQKRYSVTYRLAHRVATLAIALEEENINCDYFQFRIYEVLVKQGDYVQEGDPIAKVCSDSPKESEHILAPISGIISEPPEIGYLEFDKPVISIMDDEAFDAYIRKYRDMYYRDRCYKMTHHILRKYYDLMKGHKKKVYIVMALSISLVALGVYNTSWLTWLPILGFCSARRHLIYLEKL